MPVVALPRGEGADDYVTRLDALCAAVGELLVRRYTPDEDRS